MAQIAAFSFLVLDIFNFSSVLQKFHTMLVAYTVQSEQNCLSVGHKVQTCKNYQSGLYQKYITNKIIWTDWF